MQSRNPLFAALVVALATCAGAAPAQAFSSKAEQQAAQAKAPDLAYPTDAQGRRAYYLQFDASERSALESELVAEGGKIQHRFNSASMITALLPDAAATRLASSRSVRSIEPVPVRQLLAQATPYNIDQFQARDVWDANRDGIIDPGAPTGEGMKICIIDTGLYASHDDFQGIAISGFSQIVGQAWNTDGNGHGTHVAGTVNAMNNDIGVVGVLPGTADLHIVKVFDNTGTWTATSDLAAAAENCVANGAQVISMSLGGGASASEELVFNQLYAQGILHVAAAGNSNSGFTVPSYPANYGSVVSVAAVDSSDLAADFTQHPANSQDPNNQPADGTWIAAELSGGGVNILSTWPGPPHSNVQIFGVSAGGTDYDAVHVAGSGFGTPTAELIGGSLCQTGTGNASWSGKIVLCERGAVNFSEKINEVAARGGLAAIIYNNAPGALNPGCGTPSQCTTSTPGVFLSQADGQQLLASQIGNPVTVTADDGVCVGCNGGYNSISGTSMATPGVAAAMGFVWQTCGGATGISNVQLRHLLRDSAKDLAGTHPGNGTVYGAGYDRVTGWGLVQLKDAWDLGKTRFGATCAIGLGMSPGSLEVCGPTQDSVDFAITLDAEFTGSAALSLGGAPANSTSGFSPNPIPFGDSESTLVISNLGAVAGGVYPITVTAVDSNDAGNTAEASASLRVIAAAPAAATLLSPANGASGVSTSPQLSWSAVAEAASYLVEIATDAGFGNVVYSATVSNTTHAVAAALPADTALFWRVSASNACGNGLASATSGFTTANIICVAPNLAIPDNIPAGVNSDIVIGSGGSISDLDVSVQAAHTWVGDVRVRLIHVDTGTTVDLIDRPGYTGTGFGCSADNIDAILDDAAASPVEAACPPTGGTAYSPNQPLAGFNGESLAGTWRLNVSDNAGGDTGTLQAWCLLPATIPAGNQAPVVDDQAFAVDENSANGSVVGSIVASDPDAGDVLGFTVTGGSGQSAFAVNASSGQITVADFAQLDFETTSSFTLEVSVSDGELADSATITISINDVNEAPTAGVLAAQNGAEGVLFTFDTSAAFADPDGDSLGYTAAGLPASLSIDPSSGVISGVPLMGEAGTFAVTVTASDGSLQAQSSFELVIDAAGEGVFSHGFESDT